MVRVLARPFAPRALALAALLTAAWASGPALAGTSVLTHDGVAIGGYDPVAYFAEGQAREGSGDYAYAWNGATWYFASAEHRDAFAADPEAYAPQYGGWCAYGAAKGYAADSDPKEAWTLHDGKLYLNWDTEVQEDWREDIPRYLAKSEANWPRIEASLEAEDGEVPVYRKDAD